MIDRGTPAGFTCNFALFYLPSRNIIAGFGFISCLESLFRYAGSSVESYFSTIHPRFSAAPLAWTTHIRWMVPTRP
ncbi:hypothetical protein OESDEN_05042 [Oesophagostomum dentatum]|uniref:Uncharacterized protein n=1 Tax=Oesophagostomum dentatum TaxID=61180 RepID=A0A0B1TFY1_OESDE|nr:hypothetical protein OESDEN_05042 [Oesophagostomum dentatum]